MLTEIVYTWPDGREEVRCRRPKDSADALGMIDEVLNLQQKYKGSCPYSFRHVLWSTGNLADKSV
jgi:hypothetical protein